MPRNTKLQDEANEFDLELFRLISRAYRNQDTDRRWGSIARRLGGIRPEVRAMMSQQDRDRTK